MTMTRTYTLAAVPVSQATFNEVTRVLKDAGTEYPFDSLNPERIDMNGLCLVVDKETEDHTVERCRHCGCEWRCPDCDGIPAAEPKT